MALLDKIRHDLKEALKKGEKGKVSALRMVLSAIKNKEIEKKGSLDDGEVVRVVQGLVRQSRDAIEQFQKGERKDLVAKEEAFVSFCETYLPAQLSEEEVETIIRSVIEEVGAVGVKDMGKVMKNVMPKIAGRADGKAVNQKVRAILAENSP